MVSPIYSVVIAMFCYALANVILEQKLAQYQAITLIICWSGGILIIASAVRYAIKTPDGSYNFPSGQHVWWILVLVGLFFLADFFYVSGFTTGGNLYVLVCITMLLPVFASIMKYLWTGTPPNMWHLSAYATGFVTVLLVAKGNTS